MAIIEEKYVQLEQDGGIARITINRPESLNALNPDVLGSLITIFDRLVKQADLRVVTITGAGPKAFVAGADVAAMSQLGPRPIADYAELGQRAMRTIESCPVPVIASVNGYALGGGLELALACDLIIASDTAKVGQPEVNLGIIPGFGGTQRLVQRCGIGAARRLCYTGELLSAAEAQSIGLVDKVVGADALVSETQSWATLIAKKAPLAVRGAKSVIRQSQEGPLLAGLRLEVEEFLKLFGTSDREEGMSAFLQKREARFTGR